MRRVKRHAHGSVRFDERRGTWNYLWYDAGTRRSKVIGTKAEYPTKASAWKAVDRLARSRDNQNHNRGDDAGRGSEVRIRTNASTP